MSATRGWLAVGCSVVILVVVGSATVAGVPPPTPLCETCDSSFADPTGQSTLEIHLDEDGHSEWIERVPVDAETADTYRTDPDRLEADVAADLDDARGMRHVADGDRRNLAVELDDGTESDGGQIGTESGVGNATVVVSYTVDDLARPGLGDSWLIEYFAVGESNTRYQVVADRLTIHPPAGSVVTNDPRSGTVTDGIAAWEGTAEHPTQTDFHPQTYVTYGPDGILSSASAYATIALEFGPLALTHGFLGGLVPALGIGVTVLGVRRVDRVRWLSAVDTARLGRLLAIVGLGGGLVIAGLSLLTGGLEALFSPPTVILSTLGIGYAALSVGASRFGDRLETRGFAAGAVLATALVGTLTRVLVGPPVYAIPFLFGLSTALFLPIGYALERDSVPVVPVAMAILAPIVAAATVAPVFVFGLGPLFLGVILLPWVVVVGAFGTPLAVLGRHLASEESSGPLTS